MAFDVDRSEPDPAAPRSDAALNRRRLLLGAAAAGAIGSGGLVLRNQFLHPHRNKSSQPDGRFRRFTLASPHPAHDPVLTVALRQGVFSRYNLDVLVQDGYSSGAEALAQLQPGHGVQLALAPALSWLPHLLSGLDGRLMFGLQSGSARLLIDRRSPIKRIEDLHRKAIGITDNGADRLFFSVMMRRKGMNPNTDVAWVEMPPEQFGPAMAAGRIQAVVGHDPVIWQLHQQDHLVQLASSGTGSYGTRVSRILGATAAALRADPGMTVPLILAMQDAAEIVRRHPGETASLLADQLPDMSLPDVEQMLRAENHAVHLAGPPLREQVAQYVDELKLIGMAPDELDSVAISRRFCTVAPHA